MKEKINECKAIPQQEVKNIFYIYEKDHRLSPEVISFYSPSKEKRRRKTQSLDGKLSRSNRRQKLHARYMTAKGKQIVAADEELFAVCELKMVASVK